MRWRYSLYSLGVRITPRGTDELPLTTIETRNQQKIDQISKPILPELTNNSQGPECVIGCWKTQKEEDSGDIKALELVSGEQNGKKGHFSTPK